MSDRAIAPAVLFDAVSDRAIFGRQRHAEDVFLGLLTVSERLGLRTACKDFRASVATWRGTTGSINLLLPKSIENCSARFPKSSEARVVGGVPVPPVLHSSDTPMSMVTGSQLDALACFKTLSLDFISVRPPSGSVALGAGLRELVLEGCHVALPADCLAGCTGLVSLTLMDTTTRAPLDLNVQRLSLEHLLVVELQEPVVDRGSVRAMERLQSLALYSKADLGALRPQHNPMLASITTLALSCSSPLPEGFRFALCPRLQDLSVKGDMIQSSAFVGLPASVTRLRCVPAQVRQDILPWLGHITHLNDCNVVRSLQDLRWLPSLVELNAGRLDLLSADAAGVDGQQQAPALHEIVPGLQRILASLPGPTGTELVPFRHVKRLDLIVNAPPMWMESPAAYYLADLPQMPRLTQLYLSTTCRIASNILDKMPQLRFLDLSVRVWPEGTTMPALMPLVACPQLRQVNWSIGGEGYDGPTHPIIPIVEGLDLTAVPAHLSQLRLTFGLRCSFAHRLAILQAMTSAAHAATAMANSAQSLPLDSHARWEAVVTSFSSFSSSTAASKATGHRLVLYRWGCLHGAAEDWQPPAP